MADKEVYVGVEIPARKGLYKALGGLAGSLSDREVAGLSARLRATNEIMASPGMDGAPATPRQLEWLLHRSCSLGLPAPLTLGGAESGEWETEDLHEFTDQRAAGSRSPTAAASGSSGRTTTSGSSGTSASSPSAG